MKFTDAILILLLTVACAHREKIKYPAGWRHEIEIVDCIDDQIELYGDLCAEARDDDLDSIENHYQGVKCAAESIKICMGVE